MSSNLYWRPRMSPPDRPCINTGLKLILTGWLGPLDGQLLGRDTTIFLQGVITATDQGSEINTAARELVDIIVEHGSIILEEVF